MWIKNDYRQLLCRHGLQIRAIGVKSVFSQEGLGKQKVFFADNILLVLNPKDPHYHRKSEYSTFKITSSEKK